MRTDFKARYHGTLGGFVWALLKPMSMFVVLMGVFSFLFASNPAYKLNLIVALFLWDFFAEATKSGLTSLHARGYLLTKARVPSWILVVTSISNAVITLGVFWVVIVVFIVAAGRPPTAAALAAFAAYSAALVAMVGRLLPGVERALPAVPRSESGMGGRASGGLFHRADHLPARDSP